MKKVPSLPKVIAIVGPTASGKTALGIEIARSFGGEIISADSRGLYRGMEIISGVPAQRERRGVPHHLFSIAHPKHQYSAGAFCRESEKLIKRITKNGKVPIVVGGTGFYADTLLSGTTLPDVPPNAALRTRLLKKTPSQMYAQLVKLDPRRAKDIDPHNPVRLIRAIEIARALGSVPPQIPEPRFDVLWLGILPQEKTYFDTLKKRVAVRLRKGMVAEMKRLRKIVSAKRLTSLGAEFTMLIDFIEGRMTRAQLIEDTARWEMLYAKRQMRWFKRNKNITWVRTPTEAKRMVRDFLFQEKT